MADKTWEELTIQDNFIFGKSMETSPEICKWLLEKILHVRIKELTYPEWEKSIDVRRDSKGIRLDSSCRRRMGKARMTWKCRSSDMTISQSGFDIIRA